MLDSIAVTICAVICGADSWVAVEAFGGAKYKWLAEFLELPKGIPSHDTFRRVFGAIDATKFEECFINWIRSAIEVTQGQVIAVDGKQLRRSYDTHNNRAAIHLVSAWACRQGVALGQIKVVDKSNEKPAIPQLLEATRHHWRIENSCHWVLDVAFREDASRIRKDNSGENFVIVRRITLNLLKSEKSTKLGVANKRLKAAWDNNCLTTILATLF